VRRLIAYLFLLSAITAQGQSSVLKSGQWYKVAVQSRGVYKITRDHLAKMGFDVNGLDPSSIKIFGQTGGMVPQRNDENRPTDLVELALHVEGGDDGKFDKNDFLLFYAEGPDKGKFQLSKSVFLHQDNIYSDKNFYFITVGNGAGKRIPAIPPGSGGTPIDVFNEYAYYETNETNILRSGREWFGDMFDLTAEKTFELSIPGIVPGTELKFVSEVMGQSLSPSSFRIFYNGQQIGEQPLSTIPNSQYGVKGRLRRDTLVTNSTIVSAANSETQQIKYSFIRGASGRSTGYLSFFSIHFIRRLSLYGDVTGFRSSEAINTQARYQLSNVQSDTRIWNITDPYMPVNQLYDLSGDVASFSVSSSAVEEFIAFTSNIRSPELSGSVSNQDLHGMSTPHLVIVSHPGLAAEASRLAEHRRNYSGMDVIVVTTEQVYNEFSSGRQDVSSIRDFVKHLYDKNPARLKSLLLFGKGSYDYKDRVTVNYNLVPTYQSRNSLSPLETFSSDDYFAFLESQEGEWPETGSFDNHTLDIGVGRLPVKTPEEARIVVDKIIAYDTDPDKFGKWRKDIVFVADDGSNSDGFTSIHQSQANTLAEDIESLHPEYNTRKRFLGTYVKNVSPNGESIPKANTDIREEFKNALIINYTGHGSEKLWADERVLTPVDIDNLKNTTLPFLVTATCEFGRHDDPAEISSAEHSILRAEAGSIGLVTTTRPVNSSTNFSLNLAFYDAFFQSEGGLPLTIGEVFRRTKNNSASGVSNRNFSLLGDPSMIVGIPLQGIDVEYFKTSDGSDTLKALSKAVLRGVVSKGGEKDPDFNGTVHVTLFDKRTGFKTIGRNDPPFQFTQWYNPLFRGKATVTNGSFEVEFILPRNIAYEVNPGKLSLYAFDRETGRDASGASSEFKIGGSESTAAPDNSSPGIAAYMGDPTFVDGGTVSPSTRLVARVTDESGLNISNYGIGNTMMAVLDDSQIFLINEYYEADADDYTKGWIDFPLYDLAPGPHTITIRVWDTYNNPAQQSISFNVSEGGQLIIEDFLNAPNPFSQNTTIFFTHNRSGEDLITHLSILNSAGQELLSLSIPVSESTHRVELLRVEENAALLEKLTPGLYFARVRVRSLTDGAESTRVTKLILTN
jgi:hypothetical protein